MDKHQVAGVLDEIATLLELQGENAFRCLAYSKAARALANLEGNLADVVREGKLDALPGIGETLKDKITALVCDGYLPFYEELKAKVPPGLIDMLRLPGIGPKKIMAMHEQLGIDTLEKLKAACEHGQVAGLKGFGAKTEKKILEGIAFLGQLGQRVRLDQALFLARALTDELKKCPGIIRLEVCGSLRRRRETVKDIDILISSEQPAPIMAAFVALPQAMQVIGHGETKSSIVASGVDERGRRALLNADLRVVADTQYPFALHYFTGSKEHNIAMRQRAMQYGLKLNEYELAGPERSVPCREEADIFHALDLQYIPPEMREDTGELALAAAQKMPSLIEHKDLQGTFHCHTNWSDGKNTLEEMALAARDQGLHYLGIADHSQSLTVANGLSPQRVRLQHLEIDALNGKLDGIHLFKGVECDILPDGSLDYADDVLSSFDFIVASVHTHFQQSPEDMTRRVVRAVSHPRVTMLGHATGRLLLRRESYRIDLEAVLQAAAQHGTMIEINANPQRLELDWLHCKRARALGIPLVINPDAHAISEISYTRFGIDVARRAWLEAADVFNTRALAEVKRFLVE